MKRILMHCCVPLLLAACGGAGTPVGNKQQTERLYGSWKFTHTLNSDSISKSYTLSTLDASETPGEYCLVGTDERGEAVVAGYNSENRKFNLLDQEPGHDWFYVFNLTSEASATGCLYYINTATAAISKCFSMIGTRTSTAAALSTAGLAAAQEGAMPPSAAANDSSVLQKYLSLETRPN